MSVAVILLHGFTHTGRSWDPVIAALGERYRAVAPDIRGHGSASERQPVTLEAVLGDVAGLVDGPFTLVSSRKPDDLEAFDRELVKAFE